MEIIKIDVTKPVEHTNSALATVLEHKIRNEGIFIEPILVDKDTRIILNGHHRREACIRLGLTKIPAIIVDYQGIVTITTARGNIRTDKESLLSRLHPFKTVNFPELREMTIAPTSCKIPLTEMI